MSDFTLTLTTAGLDALVDAQNSETESIQVHEVGFSPQAIVASPTITSIPGEVKRINTVSGVSASETVIHMTAQDASRDVYDVRTFALYLTDGTLFALYSQDDVIISKAEPLQILLAFDIAFSNAVDGDIVFGSATFLIPPATEQVRGVAEIATQLEVDGATDDERIVTALKLGARLAPIIQSITDEAAARGLGDTVLSNAVAAEATARSNAITSEASARQSADTNILNDIAALIARTITGGGLVSGGGDLSGSLVLSVFAATAAAVRTGTANDSAITPAALGPMVKSFGNNGYCTVPTADPANTLLFQWGRATAQGDGLTTISYPIAFTGAAFAVVADGTSDTNTGAQDNFPSVRRDSIGATSFQVFSANQDSDAICFIAVGRTDLS